MIWAAMVMALLMVGMVARQGRERRPLRPSEDERQANWLRILEYRRIRAATGGGRADRARRGPDGR